MIALVSVLRPSAVVPTSRFCTRWIGGVLTKSSSRFTSEAFKRPATKLQPSYLAEASATILPANSGQSSITGWSYFGATMKPGGPEDAHPVPSRTAHDALLDVV